MVELNRGLIEYWDTRIRLDLQTRMDTYDRQWKRNYALVRNTGKEGFRNGNLVAEFIRTLQLRLLAQDPTVTVQPDDPEYTSQGESAAVVAQSVARIAGLKDQLHEAVTSGTWASIGWLEVGHPLDPWCLDVMRSVRSPNAESTEGGPADDWVEVPPSELTARGIELDSVQPFNPFEQVPQADPEPQPLFNPMFGYPYLVSVDPRLVVTNLNTTSKKDFDYICRLRFLTKKELLRLTGYSYEGSGGVNSQYWDLFEEIEGMSRLLFPDMLLVAQVYIIRDRNNPEYNGHYFAYVFGDYDHVIQQGPRPYGGMLPLTPVKLSKLKKMYDITQAEELSKYADLFDLGIKSMIKKFRRMLNTKWAVQQSSGLSDVDDKRLHNDEFSGTIKVNDVSAIKQIIEEKMDLDQLQMLAWVKSLAQSSTGASDLDRGTAIKDITARQTQALLDATGINIEGMKESVSAAATEVVMKMMHLVGLYNHVGRARNYVYGKRMVSMDRGTHDFTSSFLYDVKVVDSKVQVSNEERLVWVQLIKTLFADTGGVLLPYLDKEAVAEATIRKFGEGPDMLASRAAGRAGIGEGLLPPQIPQVQGGQMGNVVPFAGMGGGNPLTDMVQGQHPERTTGSRGLNIGNALTGMSKIGTGMGE